jgi:hypothetical protein
MRVVLMLLSLIAAAPALAQWVKVDEKDNAIHYIDRTTITQSGAMRRVWVTQYLREKGPDGEMSRRAFLEYDCAGRRFRYLSIAKHSALAAGGQTPSSQGSSPGQPSYIPAAIDDERVQRIVCAP